MKIDFNNVRKKALDSYNKLVKKLNCSICTDIDYARVIVPIRDIQRDLDNLRDALIGIGCTYNEKDGALDPDFLCVLNDNDDLLTFNPEEED